MAIGRRYLVRRAGGDLVEVSRDAFDRADDGVAPLAEFAGRCVELVLVVLVLDRNRPPLVSHIDFPKVYFDQRGFVDAGMRERMIRLMLESCRDLPARRRLDHEFGWRPDRKVLSQILHRFAFARSERCRRDLGALPALGAVH